MSSIPAWAVRGAKVVCTRRKWRDVWPGEIAPSFGQILTIRETREAVDGLGGLDLLFEEIVNAPQHYREGFLECGWHHSRFAPLVSTKTEDEDLAHFRPYLHQPVRESERA